MVKAGNDNSKGSKVTVYESSKVADNSIYKDPLHHTEFKPTEFKPTTTPYEYKPYKPATVGMYGDKPYERKTYQEPNIQNSNKKPKVVKLLKTFESYRFLKGPDIKIDNTGPEYKVRDYQLTSYKPGSPYKPQPPTENQCFYKEFTIYKGDVTYKLTEDNNAAMRHWSRRFVDDTVASKHYTDTPGDHYKVKDKPKLQPKKSAPTKSEKISWQKPKVVEERAQVVAVDVKSMPTQTSPLNVKSSSTQYDAANVKTFGTQYERIKMETLSVQTQSLPPIIPLATPKVLTKSAGVQCTEVPPKSVKVTGTQSDVPNVRTYNTHTSSMLNTAEPRTKSPLYAQEAKRQTAVYTEAPRKPSSPELYVLPIATAAGKPETHTVSPTYATVNNISRNAYENMKKSSLPPEVGACIEAYDNAHGPNLDALPSIKRSMQLV